MSPSSPLARFAALPLVVLICACGDAPAPRGSAAADSAASSHVGAKEPRAASSSSASAAPSGAPSAEGMPIAPSLSASAAPAAPPAPPIDLAKTPELLDADGKPLPQTDDRPSISSPAFQRRLELVFAAIVADDPTIGEPAFFPKIAYEQVKDIKNPGADWKSRLLRAFGRNIHAYHKDLGESPEACRLLGIEVDEARVKIMAKGKEGNKLPYHRVTRSKIRWADAAGKERTFELTSLIAWRGEWFVVHLHGFK